MTEYEKLIKRALIDHGKTVGWLCGEVREKTGMYFDTSYLSKIYHGNRPKKIITAINAILGIEDNEDAEG